MLKWNLWYVLQEPEENQKAPSPTEQNGVSGQCFVWASKLIWNGLLASVQAP